MGGTDFEKDASEILEEVLFRGGENNELSLFDLLSRPDLRLLPK